MNNLFAQKTTNRYFDSTGRMNIEQYSDSSDRHFIFDNMGNPIRMNIHDPCSSKPKPIIIASGPVTLCAGDSVYLSTSSGLHYLWSTGDTTQAIRVSVGCVVSVTRLDTFSIAGSDTLQCYLKSDSVVITINPLPPAITGAGNICVGSITILTDSISGGLWTSSSPNATVHATSGVVTGVIADTATITYTLSTGCKTTKVVTVTPPPTPISGPNNVCPGSIITLNDTPSDGLWSSGNTAIATVDSISGVVLGISPGAGGISYTAACGTVTFPITVNPLPDAGNITGPSLVCQSAFISLLDAVTGGIWSSSNTDAIIASGIVTGVNPGVDTISYSVTNICGTAIATSVITINPLPYAGFISGASVVCEGATITLSDGITGGTWSSSNTTATVLSGVVSGVSMGVDTVSYSVTNSCGIAVATKVVAINPLPNAGSITGASNVCEGATISLSDSSPGGIWINSNGNASVAGGSVTGISPGTDTVSYSVTNSCGTAVADFAITINPLPNAGAITGASSVCQAAATSLLDGASGGTWSASNANATVLAGLVTGITAGGDTVYYTVTNACGTATASHYLAVNPLPNSGSISGPAVVCVGATVTLTDAATGGIWSSNNGNSSVSIGVVTGVAAGTDTISYTVTNICGTAVSMKSITVNPLPDPGTITGPSTVIAGQTITLTNAVTGGSWNVSNSFATIAGGVVTGVSEGTDTVIYTFSSSCGTASTAKVISILPAIVPITGITNVCVGSIANLSDSTSGGTWSSSNTAIATVSSTGDVTGISAGTVTITYTVSTNFVTISVTVNALPGAITGTPVVCAGLTTTLGNSVSGGAWSSSNTVTATVDPGSGLVSGLAAGVVSISYTLSTGCYKTVAVTVNPIPNIGGFSFPTATSPCLGIASVVTVNSSSLGSGTFTVTYNLSGANTGTGLTATLLMGTSTGTFAIPAANLPNLGSTIVTIASISNSFSCATNVVSSNTATLTVKEVPGLYTVTGGGPYCTGGAGVVVGLSGSQTGVSYQLYLGATAIGSPLVGTGTAINFGLKTSAGTYSVVATNVATSCTMNMTGSISITIISYPTIQNVTGGGPYCSGTAGVHVGLSGSQNGVNYQLYRGSTSDGSVVAGTGNPLDFGSKTTAGSYTVIGTTAIAGCSTTMSGSVAITINPSPTIQYVSGGGTFCAGGSGFHVSLSGSQTGVTYQLFRGSTAVGSPLSGTGSPLDYGYQTINGTYTIVGTATSSSCLTTMSGNAVIVVNPLPTVYSITGGGPYCYGGTGTHIGLTNSQTGVSYQLYRGTTLVGYPVSGTGGSLDFGAITTIGTYSITATSSVGSCTDAMSGSVAVSTTALPTAFMVTGGGSYCTGLTGAHVGLAGSTPGVSYQLYNGSSPTGSPLSGTGATLDFGLQTTAGTYTVVATLAGTSCSTTMTGSTTVSVIALPAAYTVSGGGIYCTGFGAPHILLSGSSVSGANVTYYLYCNGTSVSSLFGAGAPLDFGAQTAPGIYTVVAHSNNAPFCTSTQIGSATISAVSAPVVGAISGPTTVGTGLTITLSDSTPGGTWSSSSSHASVSPTGVVTGVSAGSLFISYSVSNTGCTVSQTKSITETGPAPPNLIGFTTGNTTICIGASNTLTNSVSGGTWISGDNDIAIIDSEKGIVTGKSVGIVSITYAIPTGIGVSSVYTPVTVVDGPTKVDISAQPGTTIDSGTFVMFTSVVTNGNPNDVYQWFVNSVPVPGASKALFVSNSLKNNDIVSCKVSGECNSLISSNLLSISSTANNKPINPDFGEIKIIPNPNRGTFAIKGTLCRQCVYGNSEEVLLEITDLLGQVVYRKKVLALSGFIDEAITIDNVATSMYNLRLYSSYENKVFKILVGR